MKALKLVLIPLLVAALAACSCPAEKAAIDRLDNQHQNLSKKYLYYVENDPRFASDPKAKQDERDLLKSIQSIIDSLKKAFAE